MPFLPGAAKLCQVLVSKRRGDTHDCGGCDSLLDDIILLAWFLSGFTRFANTSWLSPGNLLRLARGIVIVPCAFPSHSCPSLESEQDTSSGGVGKSWLCWWSQMGDGVPGLQVVPGNHPPRQLMVRTYEPAGSGIYTRDLSVSVLQGLIPAPHQQA